MTVLSAHITNSLTDLEKVTGSASKMTGHPTCSHQSTGQHTQAALPVLLALPVACTLQHMVPPPQTHCVSHTRTHTCLALQVTQRAAYRFHQVLQLQHAAPMQLPQLHARCIALKCRLDILHSQQQQSPPAATVGTQVLLLH